MKNKKLFLIALAGLLIQCNNVDVPIPEKDKAPVITIGVSDKSGKYSNSYTADTKIAIDKGTTLTLFSSAYNSGGVKSLTFTLSSPAQTVTRTTQPDSKNQVPKEIAIINDNNIVFQRVFSYPGQSVVVAASAINYNGMESKVSVSFEVPYPPPTIEYLKFAPRNPPVGHGEEDGYITLGESTDIKWKVNDCAGCNVTLTGFDGIGFTHKILQANNLSTTGAFRVKPTEQFTKYILTAGNSFGAANKSVQQQIYIPPSPSSLSIFYFRVTNANYCYTVSMVAGDATQAKNLVQNNYGGMEVKQITQSEFTSGSVCH